MWRGLPGHPLHPPLTDATIGIYTFATIAALADVLSISDDAAAHGWWLALLVGLITTVPTALTGLLDWLSIFVGKDGFDTGDITAGPLLLTLIGFGLLTLGGWLGGTIVFVHGMRVLNLVDENALRASSPRPKPELEQAERG